MPAPPASIPTERERAKALMPLAPLASYHMSMCFCVSCFVVAEAVYFYGNTFKMPVLVPVHFHQLSDCTIPQNRPCTGWLPPHYVDEPDVPAAVILAYHPYPFTSFPETPLQRIANFSPSIRPSLYHMDFLFCRSSKVRFKASTSALSALFSSVRP